MSYYTKTPLSKFLTDLLDMCKPHTLMEWDRSEYRDIQHFHNIRTMCNRLQGSLELVVFYLEACDEGDLPWMVTEKLQKHMDASGLTIHEWYQKYWDSPSGYHKDIESLSLERINKFLRKTKTPIESLMFDDVEDFVVRK